MTNDQLELKALLEKVYRERGFDFREYRVSTLGRRIGRRMRARRADSFLGYARVLDSDPSEYGRLFNDLTINVASFFRDTIAFDLLKEKALPEILARGQNEGGAFGYGVPAVKPVQSPIPFSCSCMSFPALAGGSGV